MRESGTIDIRDTTIRLLFYVEQDYSFAILRPLQIAARKRGYEARWLLLADASPGFLQPDEQRLPDAAAAVAYNPHAVFAPGDRLPAFIPGIKIQVFHGLTDEKRGHVARERGLFDLYCTEGPRRTAELQELAKTRDYYRIAETGWLKLDSILNCEFTAPACHRPQILYASTFTPELSSAIDLYAEIQRLAQSDQWQWLVTLHPKMAAETVARFQALQGSNLEFFSTDRVPELLNRADIMVSDNSSILQEFALLNKPVVTYRNRAPKPYMINILEAAELQPAIERALHPDAELKHAIAAYGPSVTPYLDGKGAERALDAVEDMLQAGWQNRKPANLWRNLKMRRQLNYYKL